MTASVGRVRHTVHEHSLTGGIDETGTHCTGGFSTVLFSLVL